MRKLVLIAVALAFTPLIPAWADGGPPSGNPDTGQPSANPDTGQPSTKPDGGSGPAPVLTVAAKSSASTSGYVHPSGGYVHVPTLIEQLQAKITYQTNQVALGNTQYYGPALQRAIQQLAAAQAAANAGTPLPPILNESGNPVPVSQYAHTSYGDITSLY
jgi:hypothetical protein